MNSLDDLLRSVPDAACDVLSAIRQAQQARALFSLPEPASGPAVSVVVGFSGGADSVCLLHALSLLAPYWNLSLHAAHLDHALRAESARDASFAADFAATLGVPFHVRRLHTGELSDAGSNVEAAARAARYAFLMSIARRVVAPDSSPTIAVAHHMDDQAETMLINLTRGSGARGLGAMPWVRDLCRYDTEQEPPQRSTAVRLVRPLLGLRRAQIMDYLRAFDLAHVEDHTNRDTARLRNQIRHVTLTALAEQNPTIVETLSRTADILASEADRARNLDRTILDALTIQAEPPLRLVLDLDAFLCVHRAAQRGALRLACEQMRLDGRDVGFTRIDNLIQSLTLRQRATGPHPWLANVHWSVLPADDSHPALLSLHQYDVLPWEPVHPLLHDLNPSISLPTQIPATGELSLTPSWLLRSSLVEPDDLHQSWRRNSNPWRAFLDADRVRLPELTVPSSGMSIAPLGMAGYTKSLGDYFTDRKTPRAFRRHWPVVVDAVDGTVVWLCGHAIARSVRITDLTRCVLILEWRRSGASQHWAPKETRQCAQM